MDTGESGVPTSLSTEWVCGRLRETLSRKDKRTVSFGQGWGVGNSVLPWGFVPAFPGVPGSYPGLPAINPLMSNSECSRLYAAETQEVSLAVFEPGSPVAHASIRLSV